jgi:hypothetical protein
VRARKRSRHPIVGAAVPNQASIRPSHAIQDLEEFLAFLRRLRTTFGADDRPRRPTVGDHFRL